MNLNSSDLLSLLDDIELTQGRDAAMAAAKNHARAGREFAKQWLADHVVGKSVSIAKSAGSIAHLEKAIDAHDDKLREAGLYDSPYEKLEKGLAAYCAEHKITKVWTEGLQKFAATDEGRDRVRSYNEGR